MPCKSILACSSSGLVRSIRLTCTETGMIWTQRTPERNLTRYSARSVSAPSSRGRARSSSTNMVVKSQVASGPISHPRKIEMSRIQLTSRIEWIVSIKIVVVQMSPTSRHIKRIPVRCSGARHQLIVIREVRPPKRTLLRCLPWKRRKMSSEATTRRLYHLIKLSALRCT